MKLDNVCDDNTLLLIAWHSYHSTLHLVVTINQLLITNCNLTSPKESLYCINFILYLFFLH